MDDLARTVLHILASHIGPEQYISRPDLLNMVNAELETEYGDDRAIRKAIETLRATHEHGAFICALFPTDGESGYFMARTSEEAIKYMGPDWERYDTLGKRLNSQLDLLRGQKTIAKEQMGMPL